MTPARGFATLLLAAAAQPVAAERIAIPFAPPVGQQLAYDIDQHRPIAGQESRFSAHRTVRFERVGDGYQLYAVLRSLDSDASDAAAASFRAALTPLIGVEMRFHLDSQGKIIALDDDEDRFAFRPAHHRLRRQHERVRNFPQAHRDLRERAGTQDMVGVG